MQRHRLTTIGIRRAPDGKLQDGAGLILVKSGDTGKWVYRYTHLGRRRDMGLGQWPQLGLAEARASRDRWQAVLAAGSDPMDVRETERAEALSARAFSEATFADVLAEVFKARKDTLRGGGARGKWLSPLTTHVLPAIGKRKVAQLTRHDYANALRPIWHKKHPTAQKALFRTRIIIREARFGGYPCDPFEVDAAARILGDVRHIPKRIASTPWQQIPALFARLGNDSASECLRFMILTVVRMEGCAGARKDEIDGNVWTVPAERVKGTEADARPFRVPLSRAAREVVDRQMQMPGPYLFPSARGGRPVRDASVERVLNRLGEPGRPHGMRASFKTWVQDNEVCSWDISETVLGHVIGNRVARAYARSDLLERRAIVMEAWAAHATGSNSNVVRMIR